MTVAAGTENTNQHNGSADYIPGAAYALRLDPTRLDDAERVAAEHMSNLTSRLDGLRALAGSALTEPLDEVRRDVDVDLTILGSHAREGYDRAAAAEQQLSRQGQILTAIDGALDGLPADLTPSFVVGGAWSYFPAIVKALIEELRLARPAAARAFALEQYIENLGRRGVISKGSAKTAVLRAHRATADA